MLPEAFLEQIDRHPQLSVLSTSLSTPPEVSIRLNAAKLKDLPPVGDDECVPWCHEGRYLTERAPFTFDPAMHQGLYYVQDASSMAVTAAIREIAGEAVRYLDVCAAPGGKTTAALAALPPGSVVVANEYDYKRAAVLDENIAKWGSPYVVVSRGDTVRLRKLHEMFDIVAVDAPCSGEGMMRKDAQALAQWSPALVEQCATLQREIIDNAWHALRPGGYMIYSTCTFNTREDEDNLRWIVDNYDARPVPMPTLDACQGVISGIETPYPCYRFLPGLVRGEGLFIAVVKKSGEKPQESRSAKKIKEQAALAPVRKWVKDDMVVVQQGERVFALPGLQAAFMMDVASKLDTLTLGVEAAAVKGRDLVPTHQLALSTALDVDAFATAEVSYADALRYLRHEGVVLGPDVPRGWIVLTYGGYPLGMVKNLGNRANNLMPKSWRILSQQAPIDTPPAILDL